MKQISCANEANEASNLKMFFFLDYFIVKGEKPRRVWLQTDLHLHAQILGLPRVMSLAVFFMFYFFLFIDYYLFESLNILQQ